MHARVAQATANAVRLISGSNRRLSLSCLASPAGGSPARRAGSSRRHGLADNRLLNDRQIDDGREHAEQDRQPPHDVVRAGALEQQAAEPDTQEAADLMAEESCAKQHGEPARAE